VVAAVITRFASLIDGFARGFYADPRYRPIVETVLDTGEHRNVATDQTWFTTAYFHHPTEVAVEATAAGLAVHRLVAVEGPLWTLGARLDEILADPAETATLLDLLRHIETEPSLLGASSHLLAIGRPT
jgi:hypothetical protein